MAENNNNQNSGCSGNCLGCSPAQRAYCASQHAYSNMKVLDRMMDVVLNMQGEMAVLREKIEAIQNNEASVFDPTASGSTGNDRESEPVKVPEPVRETPVAKSPLIH